MKRSTLEELKQMLVYAECRAYDSDWMVRMQGRKDVEELSKRIAAMEKRKQKNSFVI